MFPRTGTLLLIPLSFGFAGVIAGCAGESSPSPITLIAKISGDGQSGTVGQPLAKPIQVLVTENNAPLVGATVTWAPTLSQGTLTPPSQQTDGNGLAATEWTLGPFQGLQTVTATVNDAPALSMNFTATAAPDAPAALNKVTGDNQTAMVNTVLAHVQARVVDRFENGISGVGVSWSVSRGTVSPEEDVTDPSGISSVQVTLSTTPGTVTITAVADGLGDSPAIFTAEATDVQVGFGN